ncbi:MAG: DNA alkylation repair protein [Polyangiales bacterium]
MPRTISTRPTAEAALRALRKLADPARAKHALRFFRTGKGEYGEGDQFLGITVPDVRRVAKVFGELDAKGVRSLLHSPWHEARLLALVIMVEAFRRGDEAERRRWAALYLKERAWVNNWDLVDVSAATLLGAWIVEHGGARDRAVLEKLVRSKNLWDRRIAVVATFAMIRAGDVEPTMRLSRQVLGDKHDLMHKASGWMLREAGKRDLAALRTFLRAHAHEMPRTMLRYAIERMTPGERAKWMQSTGGKRPAGKRAAP